EDYNLAVLRHTLTDPETGRPIPCRVIFVYSSADAAICRQTREQDIERLRGLGADCRVRGPWPPQDHAGGGRAARGRVVRSAGSGTLLSLGAGAADVSRAGGAAAAESWVPSASLPLHVRVRCRGRGCSRGLRRALRDRDDGAADPERRRAVHPV